MSKSIECTARTGLGIPQKFYFLFYKIKLKNLVFDHLFVSNIVASNYHC